MKRISVLAPALLALLLLTGCKPTAAPPQSTPTPPPDALSMISPTAGWALGSGKVLRTTDGGHTWKDVTPPDATLPTTSAPRYGPAYFHDDRTGWVAGRTASGLAVFRTADGGATWKAAVVPGYDSAMDGQLSFQSDNQHGWMMVHVGAAAGSEEVAILQTADGGANWTEVANSRPNQGQGALPFGGDKTGLTDLAQGKGWVTGFTPVSGHIYLYASHDDGKTWQAQAVSVPQAVQQDQLMTYPPIFFNTKDGVLPAVGGHVLFYMTHDGGATWAAATPVQADANAQPVWDFTDASHGWVWTGANLQTTADGGLTWTAIDTGSALQNVRQLDFVTDKVGWALLGDPAHTRLLKTEDGGRTWKEP